MNSRNQQKNLNNAKAHKSMFSLIASTHIIPKEFTGIVPYNQSYIRCTERKLFNIKSIKKLLSNYISSH